MMELKELKVEKKVYWIDRGADKVSDGLIKEIRIRKNYVMCAMRLPNGGTTSFENKFLYGVFSEAEIILVDELMCSMKKHIHSKAIELKELRERKSDALTLSIGKIETSIGTLYD